MANPQQPELRRSGETPSLTPEAIEGELNAKRGPGADDRTGTVPPENQPGQTSGSDPDKPDLDAFAAKYGIDEEDPSGDRAAEAASAQVSAAHEDGGSFLRSTPLRIAVGAAGLAVAVKAVRKRRQEPHSPWERLKGLRRR